MIDDQVKEVREAKVEEEDAGLTPEKMRTILTIQQSPLELMPMSPPRRPSSATQTPPPAVDSHSHIARSPPRPFDYVFLTEDRVSSWSDGRQAMVSAGIRSREDEDAMDLATMFQELIRATLDQRIDATDAGNCVREILGPDQASANES